MFAILIVSVYWPASVVVMVTRNYRDEPGNEMARSRVGDALFSLVFFRSHTVWTSRNLWRGLHPSLTIRSLYTIAAKRRFVPSRSISRAMLPVVHSRTVSSLPWSDVHPYNAVRVRLEGEWEDEQDFRRCLRGEKRPIN